MASTTLRGRASAPAGLYQGSRRFVSIAPNDGRWALPPTDPAMHESWNGKARTISRERLAIVLAGVVDAIVAAGA